jgi:hypothetical protein
MIEINAETLGKEMEDIFGERIADPEIFPRIFEYQATLAKYNMVCRNQEVTVPEPKETDD